METLPEKRSVSPNQMMIIIYDMNPLQGDLKIRKKGDSCQAKNAKKIDCQQGLKEGLMPILQKTTIR